MQKQSKEEYAICLKSVISGVQCGQCKTWYRYRGKGTAKKQTEKEYPNYVPYLCRIGKNVKQVKTMKGP